MTMEDKHRQKSIRLTLRIPSTDVVWVLWLNCVILVIYGLFTMTKFVSETVFDRNKKKYLPWPPWATLQEIETVLSVSRHPRWPR